MLSIMALKYNIAVFHSLTIISLLVDVWSLAFSANSQMIATGSHNGKINLFSVEEGKKHTSLDTRGKFIMSVAYVSVSTEDGKQRGRGGEEVRRGGGRRGGGD